MCWRTPVLGFGFLLTFGFAAAQSAGDGGGFTAEEEAILAGLDPELAAEVRELAALQAEILSPVQTQSTLAAGIGWRENILLSVYAPEGRLMMRGELEAFWHRQGDSRWETLFFLNGLVSHYTGSEHASAENMWFGLGGVTWHPVAWAELGARVQGYHQQQVLDLSTEAADRVVGEVHVNGGIWGILPQFALPAGLALSLPAQVQRRRYRDFAEHATETRGGAKLTWEPLPWLEISGEGWRQRRKYDERLDYNLSGRPIPNTRLRYEQRWWGGSLELSPVWQGNWTLKGGIGRLTNRDQAFGFYDYDEDRWRVGLDWERDAWLVETEFRQSDYAYLNQTVGVGLDPEGRSRRDRSWELRVERVITSQVTLWLLATREIAESNEEAVGYRDQSVLVGLRLLFD